MTVVEQIKQLEIEACFAMKQDRPDGAERAWKSMLIHAKIVRDEAVEDMDPTIITSLQNLLCFAARSHKEYLLELWLWPTWEVICWMPFPKELGEFVNTIAFVVADRKDLKALPRLQRVFKQYLHLAKYYQHPLDQFATEWLSIAAENALRGLSECSIFLVQNYLRILYLSQDWDFLQKQLRIYYMHFQVACQRNGYEKAYQLFGLIHYLEILLAERIEKMSESPEKLQRERRFYRSLCALLCNIAKVTEKPEKEIFALWKHLVCANESPKLQGRFEKLYDKEVSYWREMKPASFGAEAEPRPEERTKEE